MKAKILLISLILISTIASAQVSAYLDTNNIKAPFRANGDMFWDGLNNYPYFEAPKGSGKHSICSGN